MTDQLKIWIPAVVSIITLIINMLFYIFVQPKIADRAQAKEKLRQTAIELLSYMSDLISYEDFDGVPTQIRKYSLQLHMQFKTGTADERIKRLLEEIFQEVKTRKNLTEKSEIASWNENFRILARRLRKEVAKYCGTF